MNITTTPTPNLSVFSPKPLLIGFSMILAAILAMWMKPTQTLTTQKEKINLEAMIPRQFKNWKVDESIAPQLISPDLQASINEIYDETLSRTYINGQGERIMLSIAYGGNQSDNISVHFPEGCYGGQGFAVSDKIKGLLPTNFGNIPVSRLIASKELRNEPITYWIMIGDTPTRSQWEMKKANLMYTLKGQIADGMLVRISSISANAEHAYELQRDFTESLLEALSPVQRKRLIGDAPK
jgi:EpsI family protein